MTAVEYAEPGASWWPVSWGPGFALLGLLVEWLTPGPAHPVSWVPVGGLLAAVAFVWTYGRRRLCSVRLTAATLVVGGEALPVSRISELSEVRVPVGSPVLGGGATAPKGTGELPLLLDDGSVVIAWAKQPEALAQALRARLDG